MWMEEFHARYANRVESYAGLRLRMPHPSPQACAMGEWALAEIDESSRWINALPPGKTRDVAPENLVGSLSKSSPETAWTWALSVQTPESRARWKRKSSDNRRAHGFVRSPPPNKRPPAKRSIKSSDGRQAPENRSRSEEAVSAERKTWFFPTRKIPLRKPISSMALVPRPLILAPAQRGRDEAGVEVCLLRGFG